MKNRALLSAVAVCFLVAGCQKKEEPAQPKVADKVVPVPSAAPTAPPASAAQDAKPAQLAQITAAAMKGCSRGRGNCKIKVTVQTNAAGDCTKIIKDPDSRGVWAGAPGHPERDVPIVWELMTQGWEFDAAGVNFSNNPKFKNGAPSNKNRTFTWTDVNDDTGKHDYVVKVVNSKTKKPCEADPSIVNGVLVEDTAPPA